MTKDENEFEKAKLLYDLYNFDEKEKGGEWIMALVLGMGLLALLLVFSGLS